MAKQTFTTGQVLTAAQMTSLQQTAMGGGSATAKTASYVLVAADAGTTVAMNAAGATTITVNTALFAAGDTVFIQNLGAGACTVTAGTATVATAGSLILPQNDAGILYFTATGASIFYDYIQAGAVSPLTTKGDVYTFSTSDARLGVGANNTVLTADSAEATGLKWAAAGGGGMTLLQSGNLSGAVVTLSSISADYVHLYLQINDFFPSTDSGMLLRPNNLTSGYLCRGSGNAAGTAFDGTVSTTNVNFEDSVDNTDNNNGLSLFIYDYTNTVANKNCFLNTNFVSGAGSAYIAMIVAKVPTTSAISSFTITTVSGTFSGGSYKLYGVK